MNIKTLIKELDFMQVDARIIYLERVLKLLSPVSRTSLQQFQDNWDCIAHTYREYVIAQNEIVTLCIESEISDIGHEISIALNLEPITLETELLA